MFTRTFNPKQFLRSVFGTESFADYCHSRGIVFEQVLGFAMREEDYMCWQEAMRGLPESMRTQVEREFAQVNEMANHYAITRLTEATRDHGPPPDDIPRETALALWYFLHHPGRFHEVLLQLEIAEAEGWRTALTRAGIELDEMRSREVNLARTLKDFFRASEGTGAYCAVESHRLDNCTCFVVYLSDRLHLFEVFTEEGRHSTQAARPAFAVLFAYYPDGRILLRTRHRSFDKILELFRRFGQAVLKVKVEARDIAPAFHLDLFKKRFDPLSDAPDMEMVRVKALHLVYPEREGRRKLKLETLAGDGPFAILDLLRAHVGEDDLLDRLNVYYAELHVRLRLEGKTRNYLIRLFRDRCSLDQTPLGERLRTCLRRWGIADGL